VIEPVSRVQTARRPAAPDQPRRAACRAVGSGLRHALPEDLPQHARGSGRQAPGAGGDATPARRGAAARSPGPSLSPAERVAAELPERPSRGGPCMRTAIERRTRQLAA